MDYLVAELGIVLEVDHYPVGRVRIQGVERSGQRVHQPMVTADDGAPDGVEDLGDGRFCDGAKILDRQGRRQHDGRVRIA